MCILLISILHATNDYVKDLVTYNSFKVSNTPYIILHYSWAWNPLYRLKENPWWIEWEFPHSPEEVARDHRLLCWLIFFYTWPLNVEPTCNLKASFSTKESMLRWLYFRESAQTERQINRQPDTVWLSLLLMWEVKIAPHFLHRG